MRYASMLWGNVKVIGSPQIQSDWTQADNTKKDYIKNKPTIPAAQIQSDWDQTNNTQPDYIKNKPTSFGSTTYKALTDTFDDSFTGKDLNVPVVDEANDELVFHETELATFFSLFDFDETTYTGKNGYIFEVHEASGKVRLVAKPAIPVKASGAELNTGTDDAKFATAKALKDGKFVGIHVGTSPPSDTSLLWLDTN